MLENNMNRYMSNPRAFVLKKWLGELLKERYQQHDQIADRVAASLITESDLEQFGKLMTEIFDLGYTKAINDYREQFEKLGVQIKIIPGA